MVGVAGCEECERDLRHVGFLAPQARPEHRVDHRLDGGDIRNGVDDDGTGSGIEELMRGEMRMNARGDLPSHRVRTFVHLFIINERRASRAFLGTVSGYYPA